MNVEFYFTNKNLKIIGLIFAIFVFIVWVAKHGVIRAVIQAVITISLIILVKNWDEIKFLLCNIYHRLRHWWINR